MAEKLKPLTPKRKHLIDEFMIDCNAARAARAAGYSPVCAKETAYKLLRRPEVKAEIEARQARQSKRLCVTADQIHDELARIAFADMTDYIRPGPNGEPIADLARLKHAKAYGLVEIDAGIGRGDAGAPDLKRTRIKLADKRAALVSLAKLLGYFNKDAPQPAPAVNITFEDEIV